MAKSVVSWSLKFEYGEICGLVSPENYCYYYYNHRMLTATSHRAKVSFDKIYHRFSNDFRPSVEVTWSLISPKNSTQLFCSAACVGIYGSFVQLEAVVFGKIWWFSLQFEDFSVSATVQLLVMRLLTSSVTRDVAFRSSWRIATSTKCLLWTTTAQLLLLLPTVKRCQVNVVFCKLTDSQCGQVDCVFLSVDLCVHCWN